MTSTCEFWGGTNTQPLTCLLITTIYSSLHNTWIGASHSATLFPASHLLSQRKSKKESEVAQSPTRFLCPCNFPARVLEWVVISFSRGSSRHRNGTQVSCNAGRCCIIWAISSMECEHKWGKRVFGCKHDDRGCGFFPLSSPSSPEGTQTGWN